MIGVFIGFFIKSTIWAIVMGIVVLITGVVLSNMAYTRTYYAITNKRTVIQSGIIGRDFDSINYDRMQNVRVSVGILGMIFKVGTINIFTGEIETVSTGKNSTIQPKYDKFNYVASPYDVLKKLQTHLSNRKEVLS